MYEILLLKQAKKDFELLEQAGLKKKASALLNVIRSNPYQNPPSYKKLKGPLSGFYSRRLNAQHRLVYTVDDAKKTVTIAAAWTHYE
jgi:Txe/YoeB family toxin of toxin-antitoxin system